MIQLRHVRSKKFITISRHTLAKYEKENMRVGLSSRGDSTSCLIFNPRYKYDRDGQNIMNQMEAVLRVHERPGEYLHSAKKFSYAHSDQRREVNCSLETSAWTICSYQQARGVDKKNILAGQLVYLQDSDTSSYLMTGGRISSASEDTTILVSPNIQVGDASCSAQRPTQCAANSSFFSILIELA